MELEIGTTNSDTSLAESWFSSDTSTGYLEDAITGWGVWCKQQNSPSYSLFQDQKEAYCLDDHVDLFPTCSSSITQLHDDCEKFNTIRSQSSSQNDMPEASTKQDTPHTRRTSRKSDENEASVSKSERKKKIAYPFEMVKRGGIEGETALEDINQQMLMRPTKPIPHPVGDCVARPCASARGFGISGKAVVALTRIHTQGRGSITIVRTRG